MERYNDGQGIHNPYLDGDMQPLALSEGEIDDVVALLATLTSGFFFSSRRRHTRLVSDWSSDVCSSDLVHGGVVQGIGQVLMEQTAYDAEGQFLTGSYMDYAIPRASDLPGISFESHPVPAKTNPLGVKGCGERSEERRVGKECRAGGSP